MAIYQLTLRTISRAKQGVATKSLAYCGARKVVDKRTGKKFDFTKKIGVVHDSLILPPYYQGRVLEHEDIWNDAESAEKRSNSTVARECIAAIPHELPRHAQIALFEDFCAAVARRFGVALSAFLHEPDPQNRTEIAPGVCVGGDMKNVHVHILISTRQMDASGKFQKKTRELDSWKTGPRLVRALRRLWQWLVNKALKSHQIGQRVDCRSYLKQNIGLVPNIHLGNNNLRQHRIAEDWTNSRIEQWLEIRQKNIKIRQIKAELEQLEKANRERTEASARASALSKLKPIQIFFTRVLGSKDEDRMLFSEENSRLGTNDYSVHLRDVFRGWDIDRYPDYYELRSDGVVVRDCGASIQIERPNPRIYPAIKRLLELKGWPDPACTDQGFLSEVMVPRTANREEEIVKFQPLL